MKRDNLQLMADHLKNNVKQVNFDMGKYRGKDYFMNLVCGSVGCTVGTCTVLDAKNVINNFTYTNGEIDFMDWSKEFTGMYWGEDEWDWCFGYAWAKTDNTPIGAALRIEWLLNNGLPENWISQMYGKQELCYM